MNALAASNAAGELPSRHHARHEHGRTPSLYRFCDRLTEGMLYFMVVFGPWAFGTTQTWAIWEMNGVAYGLGLLLVIKWIIRWRTGYCPPRWGDPTRPHRTRSRELEPPSSLAEAPVANALAAASQPADREKSLAADAALDPAPNERPLRPSMRWHIRLLAVLTLGMLAYVLVGAINARAVFHENKVLFEYRDCIEWLPHSYDRASSWFAFWQYLGLACIFWALRDYLMGKTRTERMEEEQRRDEEKQRKLEAVNAPEEGEDPTAETHHRSSGSRRWNPWIIPARLQKLLLVLCINGGILAAEGIIQRAAGCDRLLGLIQPQINRLANAQFGPYAYRSNAAQYFNLLWPVCAAFAWLRWRNAQKAQRKGRGVPDRSYLYLGLCAVLMAACPILATTRGGFFIWAGMLPFMLIIMLIVNQRLHWRTRLGIWLLVISLMQVSIYFGWDNLKVRFDEGTGPGADGFSGRMQLWEQSRKIAEDYPWFGVGAGSYTAVYYLYRTSEVTEWLANAHNDWLETRITLGWIGFYLALALLLLIPVNWFWGSGFHISWVLVATLFIALAGCLIHALYDFPLQIHSIQVLFLIECVMLACAMRKA